METSPDPWIGELRHSHDRLQGLVAPLDPSAHPAHTAPCPGRDV